MSAGRGVAERVRKLKGMVEQLVAPSYRLIILEAPETPAPFTRLDDTRCAYVVGGSRTERPAVIDAYREGRTLPGVVVHPHKPGASRFIVAAVAGSADEVAAWGARGDRKTTAALDAVAILAQEHRDAGLPSPLRVMVPTGTMREHEVKLVRSLVAHHQGGQWSLRDDSRLAVLTIGGIELAHLDLFGTLDPSAMDRIRAESHLLWAEEIAPAALEGGGGVGEDAYSMGLTSCRLETPRKVALVTSNYPDEDYWAWQRFEGERVEGDSYPSTVSVRIPAGESASAEDRERWAVALQNRPDLAARLLDGQPGSVVQGPQVAKGYLPLQHVAKLPLVLARHTPLWLGWDSAPNAHCHATIIGQRNGGAVRIFACLVSEETGLKQHLETSVLPWMARRCGWALERGGREYLYHRHDPVMDTQEGGDFDVNPVARIRTTLGGSFQPGPVDWAARSGPMLAVFNMADGRGGMALQIDPGDDTLTLRKSLAGRWHYAVTRAGTVVRDLPAKPNHPWEDAGDAFCYLLAGMQPSRPAKPRNWTAPKALGVNFSPWTYGLKVGRR